MSRVPSGRRLFGAVLVAGLGCSTANPTELCACTYPPTAAVQMTGSVLRAGVAVPGIFVREETYAGACQPTGAAGVPATLNAMARATQADAAGRYQLVIRTFDASAPVCIRLTAYALSTPTGPADDLAQVERPGLRLRDSRVGGAPLDTVRVDFALP